VYQSRKSHVGWRSRCIYCGPDLDFKGKLFGHGDVRIEGRFEGEVDIDGVITVGPLSRVTAPTVTVDQGGEISGGIERIESDPRKPSDPPLLTFPVIGRVKARYRAPIVRQELPTGNGHR
jgi:cytoskeletal protein CcmA (bactofilin family)